MTRTKWFFTKVQSYGVPHEESIILPSVFTIALLHRSEIGTLNETRGAAISAVIFAISGFWLGISWKSENALKLMFRACYIGILVSTGYALSTNEAHTSHEYVRFSILVIQSLGLLYYVGWMFGTLTRQTVFITDEQRAIASVRRQWIRNFFRKLVHFPPLPVNEIAVSQQHIQPESIAALTNSNFVQRDSVESKNFNMVSIKLSVPDLTSKFAMIKFGLGGALSLFLYKAALAILLYFLSGYVDQLPAFIRRVFFQ